MCLHFWWDILGAEGWPLGDHHSSRWSLCAGDSFSEEHDLATLVPTRLSGCPVLRFGQPWYLHCLFAFGYLQPNRPGAQEAHVKVHRDAAKWSVILVVMATLAACVSLFLGALGMLAMPSTLDGLWLADGYGTLFEIQGGEAQSFEVTAISCIAVAKGKLRVVARNAPETVLAADGEVMRFTAGASPDTRWVHHDGSASSVLLRRTNARPKSCDQAVADTPLTNYAIFWQTFAENYAFFALRQMDWKAIDEKFRPTVTVNSTPEDLFETLSRMVEPLHDAHIGIFSKSLDKKFHGHRPSADWMQKEHSGRITDIIRTTYVHGDLHSFCNGQLEYALLENSVGYLRIHSFDNYVRDAEFSEQLNALETALDDIFKNSANLTGLVIDVRINSGGSDVFGISIASRLATHPYLAYNKVVRNDTKDTGQRTEPQPSIVKVSTRPGFRGPVVLLTSADSVSAAETFTMALLDREPRATRVGTNTQGVFSDTLHRKLPNGWEFWLPNEIYLTKEGKAFDGAGVPPDIDIPVFTAEDLTRGRDSGIDKALAILVTKKP